MRRLESELQNSHISDDISDNEQETEGESESDDENSEDIAAETVHSLGNSRDNSKKSKKHDNAKTKTDLAEQQPLNKTLYLPLEIISCIFQYVDYGDDDDDESGNFPLDLLFVCKNWYHAGLRFLYECPVLKVGNFQSFVETISNSDYLGTLVKILDLRNIIQSGKNSYTARLLRRCSATLETFIAPQTSFGYAPLMSLRQCKNLRTLDLSLVSEAVDLRELFSAIAKAQKLERLEFPRSSVFCQDYDFEWPVNLKHLGLSGGITNDFINRTSFPQTIKWLSFSHCPFIGTTNVRNLAYRLGPNLTSLTVLYPMPALTHNALDSILRLCPNLKSLNVSVDYITRHVFDDANLEQDMFGQFKPHPLVNLGLDSSGMLGMSHKLEVDDVTLALLENKLPELKYLRVSSKLGWVTSSEDMEDLVGILESHKGGLWVV